MVRYEITRIGVSWQLCPVFNSKFKASVQPRLILLGLAIRDLAFLRNSESAFFRQMGTCTHSDGCRQGSGYAAKDRLSMDLPGKRESRFGARQQFSPPMCMSSRTLGAGPAGGGNLQDVRTAARTRCCIDRGLQNLSSLHRGIDATSHPKVKPLSNPSSLWSTRPAASFVPP